MVDIVLFNYNPSGYWVLYLPFPAIPLLIRSLRSLCLPPLPLQWSVSILDCVRWRVGGSDSGGSTDAGQLPRLWSRHLYNGSGCLSPNPLSGDASPVSAISHSATCSLEHYISCDFSGSITAELVCLHIWFLSGTVVVASSKWSSFGRVELRICR